MRREAQGDWFSRYLGAKAKSYDVERCHTLRWAKEQLAVADFVNLGPVLDVPLGTGRYCDIYRSKGLEVVGIDKSPDMLAIAKAKYPDLNAYEGDIFELPFPDQSFGTVVCTRMLDWFGPEDMMRIVKEIRRVAQEIIVSIRYGEEKWRINMTHDLAKFYEAFQGLHTYARMTTEIGPDGHEEILYLRPPTWQDVLDQFRWHGCTPAWELQRWSEYWFPDIQIYRDGSSQPPEVSIKAEYWESSKLGSLLDIMAEAHDDGQPKENRYRTTEKPRCREGPAILLTYSGKTVVPDGRRRIQQWRQKPGSLWPVLHIYYDSGDWTR